MNRILFMYLAVFFILLSKGIWAGKCDTVLEKMDLANQNNNKPYSLELGSKDLNEIDFNEVPACIAIPEKSDFIRHDEINALPKEVVKSNLYIWDHKLTLFTKQHGFLVYEVLDEPNVMSIVPERTLNIDPKGLILLGQGKEGTVYQYDIGDKSFAVRLGPPSSGYAKILERLQFTGLVPKYYGFAQTNDDRSAIFMERGEGDLLKYLGKLDEPIIEKTAHEIPKLFDVTKNLDIPYTDIKPANFLVTRLGIKAIDIDFGTTASYSGTAKQKLRKTLLEVKVGDLLLPPVGDYRPTATYIDHLVNLYYKKYSNNKIKHDKKMNLFDLFDALDPAGRTELIKAYDEDAITDDSFLFNTRQILPGLLARGDLYDRYVGHLRKIYYNLAEVQENIEKISDKCFINIPVSERNGIRQMKAAEHKKFIDLFAGDFENIEKNLKHDKEMFEAAIRGLYYPYVINIFCDAVVSNTNIQKEQGKKILDDVINEAFEDAFPKDTPLREALNKLRE